MGRPLIWWTIQSAKLSKMLTDIIISSDDPIVEAIAKEEGCKFINRSPELAEDNTPIINVIEDVIEKVEKTYNYIALLEPTSPLRKYTDIDNALKMLIESESPAIVSYGEVHLENPYLVKIVDDVGKLIPVIPPNEKLFRRQQYPRAFFPYGVIYASETETLVEERTFYQDNISYYFIERWQNYEVDDIHDLTCIEAIMRYKWVEVLGILRSKVKGG
jgi:CMP-N-acetylneuraminic acid synthetase